MALVTMIYAILWTTLTGWEVAFSAKIEITPVHFEGLVTTAVNITCVPDNVENCIKEIVGIQLMRADQEMASLRKGSQMVYGKDLLTIVQAEGLIDSNVSRSFLRVTMPQVLIRDSGKYTCSVHYVNEVGFLDVDTVWDNLVVDDQDIQNHVAYLIKQIFLQEDVIKHQTGQLQNMAKHLHQLEHQLKTESEKTITATNVSAFTASLGTSYSVSQGAVLVFGNVLTRKGGGYDENTGLFTAPFKGLYAFHLMISSHTHTYVTLQVDGKEMALLMAGGQKAAEQSSVSCVVLLKAGSVVRAVVKRKDSSTSYSYNSHDSLFSGYFINSV